MDFNFGFNPFEQMDMVEYTLEIHLGDHIEAQQASQPSFIAVQSSIQLCQQLAQDSRPMKAVWKIKKYIEARDEGDKWIEETAEFCNQTWVKEFGENNETM